MSKTRKKKRKKTNILLGFVCILLAVLLGFILVTNYKTEQEESKHLSEIAGAQQNGIEDYEAVKKHAEELEKTAPEDTEDTDDSKSKNDKEKSAETEADTDNKENTDQADSEEADDSDNVYKNGNFEGSGTGYGGTITVQVTLEDDTITAVSVVSAPGEDSAYLSQGENVINSVISEQSTDVDTISGATFSSTGILEAVNDALSKAENA